MNFSLEIGCEELPHSAIQAAINFFQTKFETEIKKNNLCCEKIKTFGTPRRIIVLATEMNNIQKNEDVEILGPDVKIGMFESNKLTPAGIGFLKAYNTENYFVKFNGKNNVLAIKVKKLQNNPIIILSELIPKIIGQIQFAKTMRWESTGFRFARPIRWIYALLDNKVIPFKIAGVSSSNQTCGHRFTSPDLETVKQRDYLKFLRKKFVIYNHTRRKKIILEKAKQLSKSVNGKLKKDSELIETIANSIEYPKINLGIFDKKYLELPHELLVCEMVQHQKYLPIYNLDNTLSPYFIFVTDGNSSSEKKLITGNVRVLTARFSDGMFCYQEDLKKTFSDETNIPIKIWAKKLSNLLKINNSANLQKAAAVCTFDLTSNVVKEFPQLQGIMSSIYAEQKGFNQEICTALYQQYWPRFARDKIPGTAIGCILSLSHRIHTLTTLPISKSDTDAYGTRRAAIGLVKIIIKKKFSINLQSLIKKDELLHFIITKAKGIFSENTAKAIVEATKPINHYNIYEWWLKIKALKSINFHPIATLFKRINNILEQQTGLGVVSKELLIEPSELLLYKSLLNIKQYKNYKKMLNQFIELQTPINTFFKDVTIMCENKILRENRLNLLNEIHKKMLTVADFCKLTSQSS